MKNSLNIIRESRRNINHLLDSLYYPWADSKILKDANIKSKIFKTPSPKLNKILFWGLFYKSPAAYIFLRNNKQITLFGLFTIRLWIDNLKFRPAFNPGIFRQLTKKAELMSQDELYCSLIFVEIPTNKKNN